MLFECAVEPDAIIAAARSRRDARDFVREFAIGQPNVISDYPAFKRLRSLLRTSIPGDLGDNDLMRLDELITFMRDALRVKRSSDPNSAYSRDQAWIDNIRIESARIEFDHLLTVAPHRGLHCATLEQVCDDSLSHPRQRLVKRTAADLSGAIENMLRLASRIVFVDPYFRDSRAAWTPFLRFVEAAVSGAPCGEVGIDVLFNARAKGIPTAAHLAGKFRRERSDLLARCRLTFKAIEELPGHEKLHNRYVLTDIGGLSFGVGLSEEKPAQRDDVALLEETLYTLRWTQYAALTEFRVVEESSA